MAALRRRSQFARKPTDRFFGFHRIDKFDHALVDVVASRTFEGSNVKSGGVRGNARQHRNCFALWTWWPMKLDHGASPWIRRERYRSLSHRVVAIMGRRWGEHGTSEVPALVNTAHMPKEIPVSLANCGVPGFKSGKIEPSRMPWHHWLDGST